MKKCNCSVGYVVTRDYYSLDIDLTGIGHTTIEMFWDTGASKTIIYPNFIKGLKGVSLIKLKGLKEYLDQEAKMENVFGHYESKYVQRRFKSASGDDVTGILCCKQNVLIDELLLKNFYFFLVFSKDETKADELSCLLGSDFISCCDRQACIASDEIFTQFDEELYEQRYQKLIKVKGQKPYDLNLLMETKPKSQQLIKVDAAMQEMNSFNRFNHIIYKNK